MRTEFALFNFAHVQILGICILLIVALIFLARTLSSKNEFRLRMILGFMCIGQEICMWSYRIHEGSYDITENLPLHMCGLSICMMPIMLYTKNPTLHNLLYFWGLGGATQALLTPTVTNTTPLFHFFQFFLAHGLIVAGVLYATFVFRYRIFFSGVIKATIITVLILPFIGLVNWILGSNYFYLAHKPDAKTLLDYMGPWPWYIIPLIGLGVVIFCLVYLPFPIARKIFPTSKPSSME